MGVVARPQLGKNVIFLSFPQRSGSTMDSKKLRGAMGRFASGITVITTRSADGADHGMTASAFSSLSLDPPLLLVCVGKKAHAHDYIAQAGSFAVNVLAASQEAVSDRFAHRIKTDSGYVSWPDDIDKFEGLALDRGGSGCALLQGALAQFDCSVHAALDGGDHTIYVGKIGGVTVDPGDEGPLLFHAGQYKTLV